MALHPIMAPTVYESDRLNDDPAWPADAEGAEPAPPRWSRPHPIPHIAPPGS